MTEAVKILALIDIIFVILLAIAGSLGGVLGEITYSYLAFIVPIAIGFYASLRLKAKREAEAGVAEEYKNLFSIDVGRIKKLLPLIAPSVAIVFVISLVTSLLLSAAGGTSPSVEDRGLLLMLFDHALTPAVFEEMLFRYVPMLLIAPYSKRFCVFYSAFSFALIHCSFWQMPYAFVAGVIFMTVDLALNSVWPSVILHFINNAASVIWMKYCAATAGTVIFLLSLAVLTLTSLVWVYIKRREYSVLVRLATEKGQHAEYGYPTFMLVLLCGYLAVSNLFV